MRNDCGIIPGSRPNAEHARIRAELGELDQAREHQRLHQIAAVAEMQILVGISDAPECLRHEALARHRQECLQQSPIHHPIGTELAVDHIEPRRHAIDHRPHRPLSERWPFISLAPHELNGVQRECRFLRLS